MQWLKELNDAQREAVTAPEGPVIIMAGPGTGKTKTLTARVAWLLAQGVPADRMLALTFTHKAAREMRQRVAALVGDGDGGQLPQMTTFHGFGYGLFQDGADEWRFVSETERLEVVRGLRRATGVKDLSVRELALALSRYKNAPDVAGAATAVLAAQYTAELKRRGLHDFDDLLAEVCEWLVARPEAARFRHVLVDEFQDTSPVQFEIAKQLAMAGSLFVIGDANQSIYGFRGAGAEVFEHFAREFPQARTVRLRDNYRSGEAVVAVGNSVFANAALRPATERAGRVRVVETLNEYSEADWIVREVEHELAGTDFLRVDGAGEVGAARGFKDFAVIYRTHMQNRALRRRLDDSGLPYQVVGGGSVYEEKSVQKVTEVLRAMVGARAAGGRLSEPERDQVAQQLAPSVGVVSVADLVDRVAEKLGVDQPEVRRFAGLVLRFGTDVAACVRYLDELVAADYYDPAAEAIILTTIHSSKGLEFEHVIVSGCEEGVLPHERAADSAGLAEEQRLFYVAVTRSRERLDLLWARERGGRSARRSRFLKELPAERLVDPAVPGLVRKRVKRAQERAQGTLF